MAKQLIITEKPSVARDIAAVLGDLTEHDGYWESADWVLTFAVGHLFELLEPEELDPQFKRWTLDVLPILPDAFPLKPKPRQSERIRTIKKLLERKDVEAVVNACDAGREGELIFREILKYFGCTKPVRRLWLQSMTAESIRAGFGALRPGEELEGLAAAAECRSVADWLIGMNATRAITKRFKSRREAGAWSAGRVQTPTLALLVDRELEVLAHVPKPFWRVEGTFRHGGDTYLGAWYDPAFQAGDDDAARDDRIFDEARAQAIVAAASGQPAEASESRKPSRESAPPLFDLTSLQREANRRLGWSARRTLSAAQRCYEAHKLLTYPRTDSRCLPNDYRATVDGILTSFAGAKGSSALGLADYAAAARRLRENGLENERRTFDDSGISDHFAIIPTGKLPSGELSGDDRRLFDLVTRRFLATFHPAALWERVERTTAVAGHSFRSRARVLREPGWRSVLPVTEEEEEGEALPPLVPGRDEASGVAVRTAAVEAHAEETKPLPRITEARLLSLMENAGKQIEDEDLAAALHEKGIGTPATRAEIIENLIAKSYVVRLGKALRPTVKGIRLIDSLRRMGESKAGRAHHADIERIASPELTGELEFELREVEKGRRSGEEFIAEIKDYARGIVEVAKTFEYEELYAQEAPLGKDPRTGRPVYEESWFYKAREEEGDPTPPVIFWKDTSGRYVDRGAVKALLEKGETPVLDGFTARSGRTYKGVLELDRDEWKVKVRSVGWNEEGESGTPEYEVNTEPLGSCPICDEHPVVETPMTFECEARLKSDPAAAARASAEQAAAQGAAEQPAAGEDGKPRRRKKPEPACGFVLPRTVCKREITRDEALHYLKHRRTELLTDFTSRYGRPFSATLVLKENGRHGFEFQPRGAAARGEAGAEGEGAKAPRAKATPTRTRRRAAARSAEAASSAKPRKKAARKASRKKSRKPVSPGS